MPTQSLALCSAFPNSWVHHPVTAEFVYGRFCNDLVSYMKISVSTASLNSDRLMEQALKSVLDQNYHSFQHIVIDGGSAPKINSVQ